MNAKGARIMLFKLEPSFSSTVRGRRVIKARSCSFRIVTVVHSL